MNPIYEFSPIELLRVCNVYILKFNAIFYIVAALNRPPSDHFWENWTENHRFTHGMAFELSTNRSTAFAVSPARLFQGDPSAIYCFNLYWRWFNLAAAHMHWYATHKLSEPASRQSYEYARMLSFLATAIGKSVHPKSKCLYIYTYVLGLPCATYNTQLLCMQCNKPISFKWIYCMVLSKQIVVCILVYLIIKQQTTWAR